MRHPMSLFLTLCLSATWGACKPGDGAASRPASSSVETTVTLTRQELPEVNDAEVIDMRVVSDVEGIGLLIEGLDHVLRFEPADRPGFDGPDLTGGLGWVSYGGASDRALVVAWFPDGDRAWRILHDRFEPAEWSQTEARTLYGALAGGRAWIDVGGSEASGKPNASIDPTSGEVEPWPMVGELGLPSGGFDQVLYFTDEEQRVYDVTTGIWYLSTLPQGATAVVSALDDEDHAVIIAYIDRVPYPARVRLDGSLMEIDRSQPLHERVGRGQPLSTPDGAAFFEFDPPGHEVLGVTRPSVVHVEWGD